MIRRRIDKSLKELSAAGAALCDEAVHEARTQFKQIRATFRLVRTGLGKSRFGKENRTFRDAGRPLSKLRDAKVLLDTFDRLLAEYPLGLSRTDSKRLRQALVERATPKSEALQVASHEIQTIGRVVRKARKRLKHLPLRRLGWRAIGKGLEASYAKASDAQKAVRARFDDGDLHEWRKRTKDLRYQLEWLQFIAPKTIQPLIDTAHRLTDLLGDDHDLAVLKTAIEQEASACAIGEIVALIDRHRNALQLEAVALGGRLFRASPDEFGRRMKGIWKGTGIGER